MINETHQKKKLRKQNYTIDLVFKKIYNCFFLSTCYGSYLVKNEWTSLSIVSVEVGKKKLAFDRHDDIILRGQIWWSPSKFTILLFLPSSGQVCITKVRDLFDRIVMICHIWQKNPNVLGKNILPKWGENYQNRILDPGAPPKMGTKMQSHRDLLCLIATFDFKFK